MQATLKGINTIGGPDNLLLVGQKLPLHFTADLISVQEFGGSFSKPGKTSTSIIIEENRDGCPGYKVEAGEGYVVSVVNDASGMVQIGPLPMMIEEISTDCISLQGFQCTKESLYGSTEVDNSYIGLSVLFDNLLPQRCVLSRNETLKNYMYYTEDKNHHVKKMTELDSIKAAVESCSGLFEAGPDALHSALETLSERLKAYGPFRAVHAMNDKTLLAECLIMNIILDVTVLDKKTSAELALYCLNDSLRDEEHKLHDDNVAAYLDLFNLMFHGADFLNDLLKASIHKGDVPSDCIDELETERISETVIDEIAFMCAHQVSPYVRNDRFDVLEPMELNYFNRVILRGGSQEWYMNKGIKSLLEFLASEVERKHTA